MFSSKNFKNTIITGITAGLLTTGAGVSEGANEKGNDSKNNVKVEAVQDKIKTQVDSTLERKKLMVELSGLDDNHDGVIDTTEQQEVDTRGLLDELIADIQVESLSQEEQKLLAKYKKLLGQGLEDLAEQMVIGRRDYISHLKSNPRFKKIIDSGNKRKLAILDRKAIKGWDKFFNNFIKGGGYTGYDSIHEDVPMLAKYIAENYDNLRGKNGKIDSPLNIIGSNYNIADNRQEIADNRQEIADNRRVSRILNKLSGKK